MACGSWSLIKPFLFEDFDYTCDGFIWHAKRLPWAPKALYPRLSLRPKTFLMISFLGCIFQYIFTSSNFGILQGPLNTKN